MSVKIKDNTRQVIANIDKQTVVMIRMALDDIHKLSVKRTPMKTGDLRASVEKTMSGKTGVIKWAIGYAVYQEENQYRNYTTAGTGPDYAMRAAEKVGRDLHLLVNRAFKESL